MNSLICLLNDLSEELHFYQIDLQELLTTLRDEAGKHSTAIPPGFNKYNQIAYELLEMCVHSFAGKLGYLIDGQYTAQRLARYHILYDDRWDIVSDGISYIHTRVSEVIDRVELEHRFAYRILPNGNLFIGIDPRDLVKHEVDDDIPLSIDDLEEDPDGRLV